jgi:photosystem II stability/assembly factor-like uncharacterized protein
MCRHFILIICFLMLSLCCQQNIDRKQPAAGFVAPSHEVKSKPGQQMNPSNFTTWEKIAIGANSFLLSIDFVDSLHGIVTGTEGNFWLTNDGGKSWRKNIIKGKDNTQYDMDSLVKAKIISADNIFILGHLENAGSAIYHSQNGGETWSVKEYSESTLSDIGSFGDQVWIAGTINSSAVILNTKGNEAWKVIWRGTKEQYLTSVQFIDPIYGWCAGADGLVLHSTDGGNNWHSQQTPTKGNLQSISFINKLTGYAVGQHGVILSTKDGGNTWNKQVSNVSMTLTNVIALSADKAFIVGQNGTVLFTNDAGQHWQQKNIGTSADIYAITVKDDAIWIATSEGTIHHSSKQQ